MLDKIANARSGLVPVAGLGRGPAKENWVDTSGPEQLARMRSFWATVLTEGIKEACEDVVDEMTYRQIDWTTGDRRARAVLWVKGRDFHVLCEYAGIDAPDQARDAVLGHLSTVPGAVALRSYLGNHMAFGGRFRYGAAGRGGDHD
mgnify:CR=1 FL=1